MMEFRNQSQPNPGARPFCLTLYCDNHNFITLSVSAASLHDCLKSKSQSGQEVSDQYYEEEGGHLLQAEGALV